MKIQIKKLQKKFKQKTIFENFDLTVADQEMLCIVGKSGSGKTTLLNMLGLIENPDNGEILYNGESIRSNQQKRKLLSQKIGFIFQNFGLVDNESVYDNFLLIKKVKKMSKAQRQEAIKTVLAKVELPETILTNKVYECSGGEQQRIALAKLLIKDCEVIFADEPTASLDEENKVNVMQQLSALRDAGKTIVIVTHDDEISRYCDRVISI